jgi:uncharacterized damage-inducible protein DinB
MNADNIRQLYDYHFALNRKVWDEGVALLADEQFAQKLEYSVGSVRNQVVHMLSVDERWFSGLRGVEVPDFLNPVHFPRREKVRQRWDEVEHDMRVYLDGLTDETLAQPFERGLYVWQVLFQVLNHGTDHRAQLLTMLNKLGLETFPQDYVLHLFGRI